MARVMVVEDEPITAADLEQKLVALGHEVTWFDTGEEAVSRSDAAAPDLVLMDIRLREGLSGIDAARQIRERSDVPIVFLTAFADQKTVDDACATQPHGYLLKPFSDRRLATAVQVALTRARVERTSLERERWVSAALHSMDEAVVVVDETCAVRFVNERAEVLMRLSAQDVLGRDARSVVRLAEDGSGHSGQARHPLDISLKEQLVTSCAQRELLPLDGSAGVPVSYSAAPVLVRGCTQVGAVLVFREADSPLGASRLRQALNALSMRLSHAIANPLTYNLGALQLALSELDRLRTVRARGTTTGDALLRQEELQRLARLLRDAQHGATRIAAVVRELDLLSPSDRARDERALAEQVADHDGGEPTGSDPEGHGGLEPHPPRMGALAEQPADHQSQSVERRGSVLVIDDEPTICRVLRLALQSRHDVTTVESGQQALELLARNDAFDVILCDLSMPGMGGRQFYEQLQATHPDTAQRVMFMSGGAIHAGDDSFLRQMADRCIVKPFSPRELSALISQRVRERSRSCAGATR